MKYKLRIVLGFFSWLSDYADSKPALRAKHAEAMKELELRWRRRYAEDSAALDEKKSAAIAIIRGLSRIDMERLHGRELACRVLIPGELLAASLDGYRDDIAIRMIAEMVGRMVERELKQMNMATLAQTMRMADERAERPAW